MDVISELVGVPAVGPRRGAPPGRPARPPGGGHERHPARGPRGRAHPGRLLRGDGGRPPPPRARRPDLVAAAGRDRRRPPERRRDHRRSSSCSSWPATRRRPSCSATPGTGAGAIPTSGPSRSATRSWVPNWVEETLRYDTSTQMLVRVTAPARARPGRGDRRRPPGAAPHRIGQPRRGGLRRARALRPRARHAGPRQLRQRPPLLHGRRAGPHGGPRRA